MGSTAKTLSILLLVLGCISSCIETDIEETTTTQSYYESPSGKFRAINLSTSDTLLANGRDALSEIVNTEEDIIKLLEEEIRLLKQILGDTTYSDTVHIDADKKKYLRAHKGDKIKLSFVPDKEYEGTFDVTFTLDDGTEVKPQSGYDYEYQLSDSFEGLQKVYVKVIHSQKNSSGNVNNTNTTSVIYSGLLIGDYSSTN